MAKEVFILEADEKKALRAFRRVQDAHEKVGRGARKMGKETKDAGRVTDLLGGQLTAALSISAVVATASAAIRGMYEMWQREMEETARKSRELGRAIIDYTYLGENYKDPKIRDTLMGVAARYAIPGGAREVAQGGYNLQGATSSLDPAIRKMLEAEMWEYRRTTNLALPEMAPLFGNPYNFFAEENLDPNVVQNMVKKTVDYGNLTPQKLAMQASRAMNVGKLGGLDYQRTMAFFGRATKSTASAEQAASAMEAVILRVMFPELGEEQLDKLKELADDPKKTHRTLEEIFKSAGIDEKDDVIKRIRKAGSTSVGNSKAEQIARLYRNAGIVQEDDVVTRLRKLSKLSEEGGFDENQQKMLFGDVGLRLGAPMIRAKLGVWDEAHAEYVRDTGPDRDLVRERYEERMRIDPVLRKEEDLMRINLENDALQQQGAEKALDHQIMKASIEKEYRKSGGGRMGAPQSVGNWAAQGIYSIGTFLGDFGRDATRTAYGLVGDMITPDDGDPNRDANIAAAVEIMAQPMHELAAEIRADRAERRREQRRPRGRVSPADED